MQQLVSEKNKINVLHNIFLSPHLIQIKQDVNIKIIAHHETVLYLFMLKFLIENLTLCAEIFIKFVTFTIKNCWWSKMELKYCYVRPRSLTTMTGTKNQSKVILRPVLSLNYTLSSFLSKVLKFIYFESGA